METTNRIVNIVLAGKINSRLWPLHKKQQLKQNLNLHAGKSIFEITLNRNAVIADKILIVGDIENYHFSDEIMKKCKKNNSYIVEAMQRNTAASITFAALDSNSEDILIITPADHIVDSDILYYAALSHAVTIARNNLIVLLGIKPVRRESNYDYIEYDRQNVLAFYEKPNLATAKQFLEKGNYYWDSGIFCCKAGVFLTELQKHEPLLYQTAKVAWEANDKGHLNYEMSIQIPAMSVGNAVMNRSTNLQVVPSYFGWSK